MPEAAKAGEVIEIKALMRHPMRTGYRVDDMGQPIERHIVQHFRVTYGGEEVFAIDLTQGVAANPFFAFFTTAAETADLVFTWEDNRGEVTTVTKRLTVTG
jgi:sulfur-oxidizing protein SoxZ